MSLPPSVAQLQRNLPKLREISFAAYRRVLEVEKVTYDCHLGTQAFQKLQQPIQVEDQRACLRNSHTFVSLIRHVGI
jgi:hypothetical protein